MIIDRVCIMFGFPSLVGSSRACLLIIQPLLCIAVIAFIQSRDVIDHSFVRPIVLCTSTIRSVGPSPAAFDNLVSSRLLYTLQSYQERGGFRRYLGVSSGVLDSPVKRHHRRTESTQCPCLSRTEDLQHRSIHSFTASEIFSRNRHLKIPG